MANATRKATSRLSVAMHTADIFNKACKLHSFLLCGITVMHRCCGVYDLCSLHVAVAAPNLLFILCVSVSDDVPTSSCRVCAVVAVPHGFGTVASGMRGRTLHAHHVVFVVCSFQHCAGWFAPTRRRCGGPRACGDHRILCCHTVWVSLLLWLRVMIVPIVFLLLIPPFCLVAIV
ncbi:putative retrotransposon hot spot protein (RHS) [Trypanosoma cruzi]|uniref:Putative retrotransposon hot spot protein (RHS) n=1 Tax=Trypanosoma cruzi TaxID=5693 RepID=A0A2V2W4M6_TRYCR|nr:putative retrotransposon hot spot protein (RHS) [Trypanosoma cruzi]RNC35207.1 retrotransposon hot spot (RHS) protein [Trypanosoma cruzi]